MCCYLLIQSVEHFSLNNLVNTEKWQQFFLPCLLLEVLKTNKLQYFGLDEGDKGKYVIEFCSFSVLCVWLFTTMIYAIVLQEIRFRHM